MPIRTISPEAPEPGVLAEAAALLRAGRLVAFPTETVYGLGAHALDADAVAGIYAAKGRPSYNPLIVHVAHASEVRQVAAAWPALAGRLADAFWPGPLTLVLPKRSHVPDAVTAGLSTVAVRVPAHQVAAALLEAAGIPVAAPSANRSTEVSPTRAEHVARSLGDRVAMILDGGPCTVGIESTVVDVTGPRPLILRPGGIDRAALEAVVGSVDVATAAGLGDSPRASPGMMDRHYAPRAAVALFDAVQAPAVAAAMQAAPPGGHAAIVWSAPVASALGPAATVLAADAAGYARSLYEALHAVDRGGATHVSIERVPDDDRWAAVRDRLERAARSA